MAAAWLLPLTAASDECTSAVSSDVEEKLYARLHAEGIPCVTMSQRLALPEYHQHELALGVSGVASRCVYK